MKQRKMGHSFRAFKRCCAAVREAKAVILFCAGIILVASAIVLLGKSMSLCQIAAHAMGTHVHKIKKFPNGTIKEQKPDEMIDNFLACGEVFFVLLFSLFGYIVSFFIAAAVEIFVSVPFVVIATKKRGPGIFMTVGEEKFFDIYQRATPEGMDRDRVYFNTIRAGVIYKMIAFWLAGTCACIFARIVWDFSLVVLIVMQFSAKPLLGAAEAIARASVAFAQGDGQARTHAFLHALVPAAKHCGAVLGIIVAFLALAKFLHFLGCNVFVLIEPKIKSGECYVGGLAVVFMTVFAIAIDVFVFYLHSAIYAICVPGTCETFVVEGERDEESIVGRPIPVGYIVIHNERDDESMKWERSKAKYKWTVYGMKPHRIAQLIAFWILANICAIFVYLHYQSVLLAILAQIIISPLCDIPIKIATALIHWNR